MNNKVQELTNRLNMARSANFTKERYYSSASRLKDMRIGLPPHMSQLGAVTDWPRLAVDSVAHRIRIKGITHPDAGADQVVRQVVRDNNLLDEVHMAITDSLIYGVGFLAVHAGDVAAGEPEIIVSSESPNSITAEWDSRTKRITSALKVIYDQDGQEDGRVLFLPDETITYNAKGEVIDVDRHGAGRVQVIRIVNRGRTSEPWGQSDINRAVRYYTDAAVRTLVGMEVSREFFATPQRYILGADEGLFIDEDGNPIPAWESYIGRYIALDRDEDGNLPSLGTLSSSTPEPYTALLESYSKLCAAAADVPSSHFGLVNQSLPSSADAIRAEEQKLIQKVESKLPSITSGIQSLFDLIFDVLGYQVEPVRVYMANPATPTPAATVDATVKLIQVGAVSATSDYVYELLGVAPQMADAIRAELSKDKSLGLLSQLSGVAAKVSEDEAVAANASADRAPEEPTPPVAEGTVSDDEV